MSFGHRPEYHAVFFLNPWRPWPALCRLPAISRPHDNILMTSPPIHRLACCSAGAVIARQPIVIGDCGGALIVLITLTIVEHLCVCVCMCIYAKVNETPLSPQQRCAHIKTWLLFNPLTLTMNLDSYDFFFLLLLLFLSCSFYHYHLFNWSFFKTILIGLISHMPFSKTS